MVDLVLMCPIADCPINLGIRHLFWILTTASILGFDTLWMMEIVFSFDCFLWLIWDTILQWHQITRIHPSYASMKILSIYARYLKSSLHFRIERKINFWIFFGADLFKKMVTNGIDKKNWTEQNGNILNKVPENLWMAFEELYSFTVFRSLTVCTRYVAIIFRCFS